ncbi:dienelactone hydrolase family protein [Oscillatoria sp. FACHB-1407]|uniref:alpha/beta hydrolase n=1 Tax=Oscillatoria sp. FACHB-1407 TaxID=2692847 RepID=UPI00168632AE|nr:dienelactone hydrolase family protein [Oscillatoria sp. FACHB-1407]MBD2460587.1 dienelactone hydrolase family protein [Oscillatoria sp. FACHB-1407]
MTLNAIAIPAKTQPAQGLLVLLHGWGANAQDVAALASYLKLPEYQFVFPDAPFPHPYNPTGKKWYGFPDDYDFCSRDDFQAKPDLLQSRQTLTDWLLSLESATGVPLNRTVLAGFSQGGAMTLDVGLRLPLAALMVLSGYLHTPLQLETPPVAPVLMVHGTLDNVVSITAARQARDSLIAAGVQLDYQEFVMGHEIQLEILQIMQSFIGKLPLL